MESTMAKKMLIDATHPEETRVVVADGNKVEEFDFENLNKRQLAGNIYLAKVTRVEPSLQAAFIDYGGNRHGFLAFSEIHPDYYQIPKADRDAILAEERAFAEAQNAADEAADNRAANARAVSDAPDGGAAGDGEEDKPKKSRSRSRSRSRSKKPVEALTDNGDAPDADNAPSPDEMPSANSAIEATEASAPGIVTGGSADVSEAATETVGQGGSRDETGPQDAGPDDSGPDDEGSDDSGPVKTIAESAGLEDETVSSDQTAETASQTEAEAPQVPAGMETVDLSEGETAETNSPDAADTPVEEPAPKRTSRSRSRKKPAEKPAETQDDVSPADDVETVSGDDDVAEVRAPRVQRPKARKYKIQEVVKVRQIMLVQVVKEERGNKGAALTTYLSLAGRYCVLMPNTARGGGISRKITNAPDRKKLKEIAQEIDVPQGAGLIVRTAGAKRTKTEIKRDYEYLQRMWEQVRELTLKSIAPAPIYEEGNLIHRSIRDLYNRDIDEVIVEGEAGYRDAKDYMKLIMPSHAKNVKLHAEGGQPLFAKYGVESYLAGMFNPTVQLKSGGYIVIGITEALVAVDVNSGKSTKEGSIEDTATKTNLEAADEVARQMRLRDLAGLIVIDFIDMDERKNNAAVEKRLKDALKNDRARIQLGRISSFGLLEMSRQRLRPGMLEATTQACPHCHGTGMIRSDDSVALQILRALEEEGTKRRSREVKLTVPVDVCNYLMNEKREHLASIEARYDMAVRVIADPQMVAPDYSIEKFKTATRVIPKARNVVQVDTSWTSDDDDAIEAEEVDAEEAPEAGSNDTGNSENADTENGNGGERGDNDGAPKKKRRRRSRRKKSGNGEQTDQNAGQNGENRTDARTDAADEGSDGSADAVTAGAAPETTGTDASEAPAAEDAPKPRSRSRSRSRSKKVEPSDTEAVAEDAPVAASPAEPEAEAAPATKPKPRSRARAKVPAAGTSDEVANAAEQAQQAQQAAPEATSAPTAQEADAVVIAGAGDEPKPKRKGWWSFGS